MKTIHSIFENGMFRPIGAVELPERCEVEFEPRPVIKATDGDIALDRIYGILSERYETGEGDLAARHNEHQP